MTRVDVLTCEHFLLVGLISIVLRNPFGGVFRRRFRRNHRMARRSNRSLHDGAGGGGLRGWHSSGGVGAGGCVLDCAVCRRSCGRPSFDVLLISGLMVASQVGSAKGFLPACPICRPDRHRFGGRAIFVLACSSRSAWSRLKSVECVLPESTHC